jgi:hypothetical protein
MITSVSEVDWNTAPSRSRLRRSSSALTRLPLCPMATGPMRGLALMGWALRRFDEPVVE